jgi:Type III secretion system lipoprotein chaperone (YscW)
MVKVSGVVLLDPGQPDLDDAVLRVVLLDVTEQDAPSVTLAEVTITGVSHRRGEERAVPFRLTTDRSLPSGCDLSVAAHLATTPGASSGEMGRSFSPGDLVSTTSTPVAHSGSDGVVVRLTVV